MVYGIVARGTNKNLYHLYAYTDSSLKSRYKWFSDTDLPLNYLAFDTIDAARFYMQDKHEELLSADNAHLLDPKSISVAKLILKVHICK